MSRKRTTDEFITSARKVHGDKYDYSKSRYVSGKTKTCIICPKHGEFWQTPKDHLNGHGCRACSTEQNSSTRRSSKEVFVEKAQTVHKGKYDYSKVNYVNSRTPVCIICPEHGEFWQKPTKHLSGQQCPDCSKHGHYDTLKFVEKAVIVHGSKYDYSKVQYSKSLAKVCIICPEHGEFWQQPSAHLNGAGCPICAGNQRRSLNDFINKSNSIHDNKYDYSKVEYINNTCKVCIICPEHGEFWQTPKDHLNGHGCPKCASQSLSKSKDFFSRAIEVHGDKYDYSKVLYNRSDEKVCIICPQHGEFWQTPKAHLSGCGCPICSRRHMDKDLFISRSKMIHGNRYDYSKVVYYKGTEKVCIICPDHGEFWQTPAIHMKGSQCPICTRRTMNKELFVQRSRLVHGDKYDYSKVEYDYSNEKVCIVCPKHGEFWQTPTNHMKGYGCPRCSTRYVDTEIFIAKARAVHGEKYDYSKVTYSYALEKVCIICPEHGEFWQKPASHLSGQGCPDCSKHGHFDTNKFIEKAKEIHGNKYDYSKVIYNKATERVCIICPEHGEFWQTPHEHRKGCGCPICAGRYLDRNLFVERSSLVHGDKYDYSKVVFERSDKKVCIICPEHGEFWQTPSNHMNGAGCPVCAGTVPLTTNDFISRAKIIHGDRYDYSKASYVNTNTKVCIICKTHGEFWQRPIYHIYGAGCPICSSSHLETDIRRFLQSRKIEFEEQKQFDDLKHKRLLRCDFYLPKQNAIIECQGAQHFSPVEAFGGQAAFNNCKKHDLIKRNYCQENNISLFYYSNLGIDYPYLVYEDKDELLHAIMQGSNK